MKADSMTPAALEAAHAALAPVWAASKGRLEAIALRACKSREMASDIVSQAYLAALPHAMVYDSLEALLTVTVRTLAFNARRAQRGDISIEQWEENTAEVPRPAAQVETMVDTIMGEASEPEQRVMRAYLTIAGDTDSPWFKGELTQLTDVAAFLGVRPGFVSSVLFRLRKRVVGGRVAMRRRGDARVEWLKRAVMPGPQGERFRSLYGFLCWVAEVPLEVEAIRPKVERVPLWRLGRNQAGRVAWLREVEALPVLR